MIGDLTLDGKLAFVKLGGSFILGDLGLKLGVSGKYALMGRDVSTTGDQQLDVSAFAVIGYVGFKNVNPALCRTPSAPSVIAVGGTGSTTYTYKVVAKQADGGYTVASPGGTITNGVASLDVTHWNAITWTKMVDDAVSYDIYRTAGGGAHGQGFIQTVLAPNLIGSDVGTNATPPATGPTTTPYDYTILLGPDGTNYPIKVRGQDMIIARWNASAIHYKSVMNTCDFTYLVIDD